MARIRSILVVALFLAVLASACAFLLSFLKVEVPPIVSQWLGIAQLSITPSIAALSYIMPWVLLLMLVSLLLHLVDSKRSVPGLGFLTFCVIVACPIIVYSDVIVKTLWVVRFSSAFQMHTTTELDLGIWRTLLLVFLVRFSPGPIPTPHNTQEKIENLCTAVAAPFMAALAVGFIGELGVIVTPPSASSWPFFRYMALSCGYTFASALSFFSDFFSLIVAEPIPCSLSVAGAFFAMVFVAAWLGGKAVDILLQALLHRVERLTLPIRLPRLSMPHRPKPAMVPRPTEVRREENGIYAYVNVYDLKRRRCVPARLQVDTGANVSLISEDKLKKLGVKPITKAESTLADGRKMMRDVGYALIECRGKESTATVIFGKGKDSEVLGGATIEGLGIGLNFKGRNAGQQTNYHLPYWFGKCGDPAGYVKAVITSKKPQVAFRRLLCDAWTAKSMDDSEAFTNICLAIQEVREKYWNIVKLRRKDDEEAKRITEEGLGIPRGIAGTASVEGEPAPRDVGQQPTDQATSEELEQCGVPKPFKEFTANDEDAAKAEANKGRLVAIYIGRAKWDLYGRKYSYYALPKNVAEQLVAGKIVKPESQNEDDVYRQLCYREYLKGEGEGYRLQSERLKTDLTWQLLRLKSPKEYIV